MADYGKTIKGLTHCLARYVDGLCDDCPYMGALDKSYMIPMKCKEIIMSDALELLKEKVVKPTLIREGKSKMYNDYRCQRCDQEIVYEQNFCCECGGQIDWITD